MGDLIADHRDEVYGDPGVHALAVAYFENIKSSPNPHQTCMELLTSRSPLDDRAKFICLEVIAEYVRNSYEEGATVGAQEQMRNFLVQYGEVQLVSRRLEEVRVRAQAADIFARVCLTDYPTRWPNFFTMLCSMAGTGLNGGDHMVRTVRRLHHLITGRTMPEQEFDRLYGAVQSLQTRDFDRVLDAIASILDTSSEASVALQKESMAAMGAWVSLIDPDVFTRNRTLGLVLHKLEARPTQKPALNFLSDLMKAVDISMKDQADYVGLVFQQLVALGLTEPKEVTEKLYTRVGTLLKETGCRMLDILTETTKDTPHPEDGYNTNLNQCFAVCMDFLKTNTISISSSVIQFFIQYVGLLRKRKKMSLDEYNNCIQLLEIVLEKIKLRPTQSFKDEMKNEVYTNYRKSLVKLFEEISSVKRKTVYKAVYKVILQQLVHKDWKKEPFPQAEYPIFLLNLLCFTYRTASAKSVRVLMKALMNSDLSLHPHPAVAIQFFQAVAKNVKFFKSESKFIPGTVAMFQEGLRDTNARVRSVAAEQLLRFVRGVGTLPTDMYSDILRSVHDASLTMGTFKDIPRFTDQSRRSLFSLIEVAGVATVRGRFTRQRKRHLVAEIVVPAMHLYHEGFRAWSTACDREVATEKICRAIDVVTSMTKAFDAATAISSGCDDVFVDTVAILDQLEQAQLMRSNIHASVTQLLFQMVYCLEDRFLPFLPRMLRSLLSCRKDDNVVEVTKLFTFVVDTYKGKILKFMRQDFIRCSSYMYEFLTFSSMHSDHEKKLENRQKMYLSFVTSLVENDLLIDVIMALDEKAVTKTVAMITRSTLEGPRSEWRIRGLVAINCLLDKWPGPGERHGQPSLVCAVAQYLVMGGFLAMRDAATHLSEDQVDYCGIFTQCSQLVKKAHCRCDNEFITWLEQYYLPRIGVCQQIMCQLIDSLTGDNSANLEEFFRNVFSHYPDIEIPPMPPSIPIPITFSQHKISPPNLI